MKDEQDTQTPDMLGDADPAGFRGPPPMVGWWNVRRVEHQDMPYNSRRWWNGNDWSIPVAWGADEATCVLARITTSPNRPSAFEWMGLAEPALEYDYLLHAKTFDACVGTTEQLEAQNNLLRLAYGPEAQEKLDRDRSDPDVVQPDAAEVRENDGHYAEILTGKQRRSFNYD